MSMRKLQISEYSNILIELKDSLIELNNYALKNKLTDKETVIFFRDKLNELCENKDLCNRINYCIDEVEKGKLDIFNKKDYPLCVTYGANTKEDIEELQRQSFYYKKIH